ncbi:ribosomal protein S18 acetylase RimI-like enzyme [Salegentibacter sp. 24]|uniref:GNAT family N-acetyltransferase n=1 Tax=Salegentibacter sp. 24 TaxID=2183986 RepID=UPI00105E6512|nr:GNAT family N-acetyltransferase [Salegentibacter sp. 24]TDN88145.1 ribosomal protein S18 acetylase RimI-like enzyme [Salegentibacter sp. 24]
MIRKAVPHDIDQIKKLTEACAVALEKQNIFQWNSNYPSREKLKEDILREELFVYELKHCIIAIMVLTPNMDKVYHHINWLTETNKNLYIHRLATHPEYWGQGYARKLMDYAEEIAENQKFTSVRLDTFSENLRNQTFYNKRGYKKLGDVYFPHKNEAAFHCYEKPIGK